MEAGCVNGVKDGMKGSMKNLTIMRLNKRMLHAGIALAVIFFILAPRSPVTQWLATNGVNPEIISSVSNAAGLAGLVFLILAATRISIEHVLVEPRLSISVPLWLPLALLGAFVFEELTKVSRWILGPETSYERILAVTTAIFTPLALGLGLALSRTTKRRVKRMYLAVIKSHPGDRTK